VIEGSSEISAARFSYLDSVKIIKDQLNSQNLHRISTRIRLTRENGSKNI